MCKAAVKCHHQQTNTRLFYRLDALAVVQPTVSEHWREIFLMLLSVMLLFVLCSQCGSEITRLSPDLLMFHVCWGVCGSLVTSTRPRGKNCFCARGKRLHSIRGNSQALFSSGENYHSNHFILVALWKMYQVGSLHNFWSCFNKCVKMFQSCGWCDSVTGLLVELGPPSAKLWYCVVTVSGILKRVLTLVIMR